MLQRRTDAISNNLPPRDLPDLPAINYNAGFLPLRETADLGANRVPTLEFEGKAFVYSHHLSVPYRELVPMPEKSIGKPSFDGNLIIHGDNLEALKALLPRYAGKVDVVYIDPPYNTGNEGWIYNDNVNSPMMKEWFGRVVGKDDMQRHDKWLCMMWPRLQLLNELLSEGGVIFMSISDVESANARLILDEIFGESSFVACFVWRKVDSPNDNKVKIAPDHEFIFCYAKDGHEGRIGRLLAPQILDTYGQVASDGRRYRDRLLKKNGKNSLRTDRPTMFFGLQNPDGELSFPIHENGQEACWSMGKRGIDKHLKAGTLIWKKRVKLGGEVWEPYTREYAPSEPYKPYPTIWNTLPTMRQAKAMIKDIFGSSETFSTPKPVELIEHILGLIAMNDAVVLDSFAGSGTTGHAVLSANKLDGGTRKFILIETEDYADTVTAERVRRISKNSANQQESFLIGEKIEGFTYCSLGGSMDTARFFDGSGAPDYGQLSRYIIFTATGETVDTPNSPDKGWFAADAGGYRVHVIYEPNKEFLRSQSAALTLDRAREISASAKAANKPALVFGAAQYVNSKELKKLGITFAQLPWSVHERLNGGFHTPAQVVEA